MGGAWMAVVQYNNTAVNSQITPGSATIIASSTRKLKQSIRIKDYQGKNYFK